MFVDQLLFSEVDYFLKILENIVLRNLMFIMSVVSLTGFISTKINLILQVTVLFCFLFYYSFWSQINVSFLTENVFILIIVITGFLFALVFFTKHLKSFLNKLNQQKTNLEENNNKLVSALENAKIIQSFILSKKEDIASCFAESFVYFQPDGYADQFGGEKGKKMKTKEFKKIIDYMQEKKITNQGNYLSNMHRKWRGKIEQVDDICVLGLSFNNVK